MKTNPNASLMKNNVSNVALHNLVDKLIIGLLPVTVSRKSFIVNDVPQEVTVCTDENVLFLVLSTLLTKAVTATESECVRIDAALTGDYTEIRLKDHAGYFYNAVARGLKQEQLIAEKIGGSIKINQHGNGNITTTFSFVNERNAA